MHTRNTLFTEAGVTYRATVEHRDAGPRLVRLTISSEDDRDLVGTTLLPLGVIAARAVAKPEAVGTKPTRDQLVAAYTDALRARERRRPGEPAVSIREELARRFGVPVPRVDSWLKRLRVAEPDALPRPFRGRPRTPSTPEENQ